MPTMNYLALCAVENALQAAIVALEKDSGALGKDAIARLLPAAVAYFEKLDVERVEAIRQVRALHVEIAAAKWATIKANPEA